MTDQQDRKSPNATLAKARETGVSLMQAAMLEYYAETAEKAQHILNLARTGYLLAGSFQPQAAWSFTDDEGKIYPLGSGPVPDLSLLPPHLLQQIDKEAGIEAYPPDGPQPENLRSGPHQSEIPEGGGRG